MGDFREKMVIVPLRIWVIILLITLLGMASCSSSSVPVSFYFWRTRFQFQPRERACIKDNRITKLYLRYFDLVYDETAKTVIPRALIQVPDSADTTLSIVPVVFVRNNIWQYMDNQEIDVLAGKTIALIRQINLRLGARMREVQMDCDWTEQSSGAYFYFLSRIRHYGMQDSTCDIRLSATIRLHQVKYAEKQGIPPVDEGVLMFYNMGRIDAGSQNSIYEKEIARRYTPYLSNYPRPLKLALPVFSWLVHIREGNVIGLINKFDIAELQNSGVLKPLGEHRFKVLRSVYVQGRYVRQYDELKWEKVDAKQLKDIARELRSAYPPAFRELIFFDLDEQNIQQYEKNIFTKVAASL